MRRPINLALVWLLAGCAFSGCGAARHTNAEREAEHQGDVQHYAELFPPGTKRIEIETYFHDRGIQFRQMCCVQQSDGMDDLIWVAKAKKPWYCERGNIYVAFEFKAVNSNGAYKIDAADSLEKVTIFGWLEGCL